jgi:hypothetical protein
VVHSQELRDGSIKGGVVDMQQCRGNSLTCGRSKPELHRTHQWDSIKSGKEDHQHRDLEGRRI